MLAIRGAIQIERDGREEIGAAVHALCAAITEANALTPDRIVSAIFTLTPDMHGDFPARAAREQGWGDVPMICAQEIPVPGALPRVCRVLLHVHGEGPAHHIYLGGAAALRPDLAK
jgi:chorismate mutase